MIISVLCRCIHSNLTTWQNAFDAQSISIPVRLTSCLLAWKCLDLSENISHTAPCRRKAGAFQAYVRKSDSTNTMQDFFDTGYSFWQWKPQNVVYPTNSSPNRSIKTRTTEFDLMAAVEVHVVHHALLVQLFLGLVIGPFFWQVSQLTPCSARGAVKHFCAKQNKMFSWGHVCRSQVQNSHRRFDPTNISIHKIWICLPTECIEPKNFRLDICCLTSSHTRVVSRIIAESITSAVEIVTRVSGDTQKTSEWWLDARKAIFFHFPQRICCPVPLKVTKLGFIVVIGLNLSHKYSQNGFAKSHQESSLHGHEVVSTAVGAGRVSQRMCRLPFLPNEPGIHACREAGCCLLPNVVCKTWGEETTPRLLGAGGR